MFAHDRCAVIFVLIIFHISINVPSVRCEQSNVSTTEEYRPTNVTQSEKKKNDRVSVWMLPLPEITSSPESREWECCPAEFAPLEYQLFNCYNMSQSRYKSSAGKLNSNSTTPSRIERFLCHLMVPVGSNATVATADRTQRPRTQCLPGLEMPDGETYKCYIMTRARRKGIRTWQIYNPCPENEELEDGRCKKKSNQ